MTPRSSKDERLVLLTWPDYLSPETILEFRAESKLVLELEIVPSADDLLARMRAPGPAPDLLCPPDYVARQLLSERLLLPLQKSKLPNLRHLDPKFLRGRPHDPGSTVSVTKDWGTTGFMYRTDQVAGKPGSWADFWRLAEAHSGRVSVLDSQGEVVGAALKLRGHSYNAEDDDTLEAARADLLRLKPHIGRFESNYRPLLAAGEVALALGWNGDAAALLAAGLPVGFVIPEEGSQIWEVDWAIAANAPNPEAAHAFIDYQLRPEVAAREAAYTRYATPNSTAFASLESSIRTDPATYPSEEILARLEYGMALSPDGVRRRETLWAGIRGAAR